jgi:hypothetical protein
MDFEETLLNLGFHHATGRTPRGVQVLAAEPNPFLTSTVQAFEDGTALFTWEFAVGEYLRTKGIQSLNCSKCGLDVHWVSGLGVMPGHWAHREPAPHGEPVV